MTNTVNCSLQSHNLHQNQTHNSHSISHKQTRSSLRKKIGHYSYLLSDEIGKGYSSTVYRGCNELTNIKVAIKMIELKNIRGQIHKKLLSNEIETLQILKNEHIIELLDVINTSSHTYLIMQLCDEGDLGKIIKKKNTYYRNNKTSLLDYNDSICLNENQAIIFMKQIISGFRQINKNGYIHRDLKPANIFLNSGVIKIADFGFVTQANQLKNNTKYNVGSPIYMPLEALKDNKYSFKSDVWAIGVIFFQLLTGHTPWKGRTQTDLRKKIASTSIKKLLPNWISKESKQFLLKSLQLNPVLRMNAIDMDGYFDNDTNHCINNKLSLKTVWNEYTVIKDNKINKLQFEKQDNQVTKHYNKFRKQSQDQYKNYHLQAKIYRNQHQNEIKTNISKKIGMLRSISRQNTTVQTINNTTYQLNKQIGRIGYIGKKNNNNCINNMLATSNREITLLGNNAGRNNYWKNEEIDEIETNSNNNNKYKILLSQLHFIRYIYKLLRRILRLKQQQYLKEIIRFPNILSPFNQDFLKNMKILILLKISQIIKEIQFYKKEQRTKQQENIELIVKQYQQKYQQEMQDIIINGEQNQCLPLSQQYITLIEQVTDIIRKMYSIIIANDNHILSEYVIILDYLITFRQLCVIVKSKGIKYFHQKAKIQNIVEGKPQKNINKEHIKAITLKLKSLNLIDILK